MSVSEPHTSAFNVEFLCACLCLYGLSWLVQQVSGFVFTTLGKHNYMPSCASSMSVSLWTTMHEQSGTGQLSVQKSNELLLPFTLE